MVNWLLFTQRRQPGCLLESSHLLAELTWLLLVQAYPPVTISRKPSCAQWHFLVAKLNATVACEMNFFINRFDVEGGTLYSQNITIKRFIVDTAVGGTCPLLSGGATTNIIFTRCSEHICDIWITTRVRVGTAIINLLNP